MAMTLNISHIHTHITISIPLSLSLLLESFALGNMWQSGVIWLRLQQQSYGLVWISKRMALFTLASLPYCSCSSPFRLSASFGLFLLWPVRRPDERVEQHRSANVLTHSGKG